LKNWEQCNETAEAALREVKRAALVPGRGTSQGKVAESIAQEDEGERSQWVCRRVARLFPQGGSGKLAIGLVPSFCFVRRFVRRQEVLAAAELKAIEGSLALILGL
jgi:hypothetical protein